jgi:hypothetical protein
MGEVGAIAIQWVADLLAVLVIIHFVLIFG